MTQVLDFTHTRGDTFRVSGRLVNNTPQGKVPIDITDYVVEAHVMDGARTVASLVYTIVDAEDGRYSMAAIDTDDWPIKTLVMNLRYILPSGDKLSTKVFNVFVVKGTN